jgi:hypothetical protein
VHRAELLHGHLVHVAHLPHRVRVIAAAAALAAVGTSQQYTEYRNPDFGSESSFTELYDVVPLGSQRGRSAMNDPVFTRTGRVVVRSWCFPPPWACSRW